ncbi:MAG TPA: Rv3654c family TadE-like protein [Micromonospora sp.]
MRSLPTLLRRLGRVGRFTSDRGSASLWLVAFGLALASVGAAGAAVGAARVGYHEARAAADLGALAAAARVADGSHVACQRAERFAQLNGARLVACHVDGLDVVVTVTVAVEPVPGLLRAAVASARAGPVRADVTATADPP